MHTNVTLAYKRKNQRVQMKSNNIRSKLPYFFHFTLVKCDWSKYSSTCSKTCGGGAQNYERIPGRYKEMLCSENSTRSCNDQPCPGNQIIFILFLTVTALYAYSRVDMVVTIHNNLLTQRRINFTPILFGYKLLSIIYGPEKFSKIQVLKANYFYLPIHNS